MRVIYSQVRAIFMCQPMWCQLIFDPLIMSGALKITWSANRTLAVNLDLEFLQGNILPPIQSLMFSNRNDF